MFKPMTAVTVSRVVDIFVDGKMIYAQEGESLAIALMHAGVTPFRHTPVSGAPRSPLCLMGACFDCLIQLDGQANVQSCMVRVKAGARVVLQHGARALETKI